MKMILGWNSQLNCEGKMMTEVASANVIYVMWSMYIAVSRLMHNNWRHRFGHA